MPTCAYEPLADGSFRSTELTRGPWDDGYQHAGPPIALVCREIERQALGHGLTHVARLTANLLRPIPIGQLAVAVAADYVGRNAGHFSATLVAAGKEVARLTALVQRETDVPLPQGLPGHPLDAAPRHPDDCPVGMFPFAGRNVGYADLVETRMVQGKLFDGPSTVWFRMRHPLLPDESPSAYQRVAVAADSGNGISAILDLRSYTFVNCDLTINLLRRPQGESICLDARTWLGPNGCGLAESALYDTSGLIGRATQSLAVNRRS